MPGRVKHLASQKLLVSAVPCKTDKKHHTSREENVNNS